MNRYFTFITLIILWSIFALAGIIRVPQDQPTIQAGINAAENSDTVLVAENTYYENIKFLGKAITVASLFIMDGDTNHINNTVINGSQPANPDSGSVVYFISGEDTNSVLSGFTITGGSGTNIIWAPGDELNKTGGGIFMKYSGAKIEKNKIVNNLTTVTGNSTAAASAIIALGDIGDYIVIRDNDINQNTATGELEAIGPVGLGTKETCLFENNRVIQNVANASSCMGGGLWVDGQQSRPGPYIIRNNIISDNILNGSSSAGGGGMVIQNCSPVLTNNIISGNQAGTWGGGGIWVYHWTSATGIPKPELINNTITNNSTTGPGGGIRVDGSAQIFVKVMNTILWGSSAPSGPQISTIFSGIIAVRYSDVQGGWTGEGNIDLDPQFEPGDSLYHLSSSSPCIDAGTHSYNFGSITCYCPSHDIDGEPRGVLPDIGADEFYPVAIDPQPVAEVPQTYALYQNYPNPFNPATTIEFALPKAGLVILTIYNVAGEKVATLVSENLAAGNHKYRWDARGMASGVYFYRLEAGSPSTGSGQGFVQTKKMLLIR